MPQQLPWSNDTELNLSDFLRKSMSVANTIMENEEVRRQASKHLGSLIQLRQKDRPVTEDVRVFDRLFRAAEQQMADEEDKKVLLLLKAQVATFIAASFDAAEFNEHGKEDENDDNDENEPKLSWSTVESTHGKRFDEDEVKDDPMSAERAENEHHARLAAEYNTYDRDDDDNDYNDDNDDQEVPRERGMPPGSKSYGMVAATNAKSNVNAPPKRRYRRNEYRRPNTVSSGNFHPQTLGNVPESTYCVPIFFPSEDSYKVFHSALSSAQKSIHVAIFSLTDNKTANVLIDAMERGVEVKVISDNDQLTAKGSDISKLRDEFKIPVKVDDSQQFMHNKFAVIDGRTVITGSFNWSIGARYHNKENVLITNIGSVAAAYEKEFQKLWQELYDA
ncbi:hypothetical protein BC940DRAFT_343488 [Gongronella butleri]|nr:hypothetical protein BC940DRAFT_343488 [Gongronella butleri]